MDDIQQRLKETSATCIASYEKWASDKKNGGTRTTLQEAIHELRKVASRLEIEMAISERDEMALKKIPIPPHRASQKKGGQADSDDDSYGNAPTDNNRPQRSGPKPDRNRSRG